MEKGEGIQGEGGLEVGSFVMDVIEQSTVMAEFEMEAMALISWSACGQDGARGSQHEPT